jgi:succinate-acetate transporter protein
LKYSRSPAYDIVSGGAAALLAGLLGFLISEKFGMEMVDSGDFYYLWMYLVFLSFSVRPLLVVVEANKSLLNVFSIRRVCKFYILVILNTLKVFK